MELNEILRSYGIRSFNDKELLKGHDIEKELIMNIIPTVVLLQSIRDYIGRPVSVHSGYRPKDYNKKIGGSPRSLHIRFNAIDFCPAGYDSFDLIKLANDIEDNKFQSSIEWKGHLVILRPELCGIGIYDNFLHLDTRGLLGGYISPARWRH